MSIVVRRLWKKPEEGIEKLCLLFVTRRRVSSVLRHKLGAPVRRLEGERKEAVYRALEGKVMSRELMVLRSRLAVVKPVCEGRAEVNS